MITDDILWKIRRMGYEGASINLWHGSVLYVNIPNLPAVSISLTEKVSGHLRVGSAKMLSPSVFYNMMSLADFVDRHKTAICSNMKEGVYYKDGGN